MKKIVLLLLLFVFSLAAKCQFNAGRYQDIGTCQCSDDDNDQVYFTITAGNTDKLFQILPCSGLLQVDTIAYTKFPRQKTWTLTIACTDPQKNTGKSICKITLKKNTAGQKLSPVVIWVEP